MKSPASSIWSKAQATRQYIVELKEEMNMNLNLKIEKVTNWLANNLRANQLARLVGGITLGAALVAAAGLSSGPAYADGPTSPNVNHPSYIEQRSRSAGLSATIAQPRAWSSESLQVAIDLLYESARSPRSLRECLTTLLHLAAAIGLYLSQPPNARGSAHRRASRASVEAVEIHFFTCFAIVARLPGQVRGRSIATATGGGVHDPATNGRGWGNLAPWFQTAIG